VPVLGGPGFFHAPGDHGARTASLVAAAGAIPHAAAALIQSAGPAQAVLAGRGHPGTGLVFALGHRETAHMRHWHKYSAAQLRPDRRFYFRRDWDTATSATAGSAADLEHELRACDDDVIIDHCQHGDFSRWVEEVLGGPAAGGRDRGHRARCKLRQRRRRRRQGEPRWVHPPALPGMTRCAPAVS